MKRWPNPQVVDETGRGAGAKSGVGIQAMPGARSRDETLRSEARGDRQSHKGFARGAIIGLAIVVPFWLLVAAMLLWFL